MMQIITVYIAHKQYTRPDMVHTHQPFTYDASGLPYQTCIMNCRKTWELFIDSEYADGFKISRQVKLYNPGNQKYLTGKHPHPKNIFAMALLLTLLDVHI